MKICAIISEYNPFHYGHLHHIQDAKKQSGADAVMVILSGNFTQRGEPTVVNKYVRARMALEAGADIVVQMPTAYASASAEVFALAGIKIANSFKNVTNLCFGCETANTKALIELAELFNTEPKEYKTALKKHLGTGISMPLARSRAVQDLINNNIIKFSDPKETEEILSKPNNILAIEYLKALKATGSKIKPIFTLRTNDYKSEEAEGKNTSATAIRSLLYGKGKIKIRRVKNLMPNFSYALMKEEYKTFGFPAQELFDDLCLYVLKTSSPEQYREVFDVTEGLEHRFIEYSRKTKDLNELLLNVKTKRYNYSRLKRITLGLLLGIQAKLIKELYTIDKLPFIKVLAFKQDNLDILKKTESNTNLIIRTNDIDKNQTNLYKSLAEVEDRATQVYQLLLKKNKCIPTYTPDLLTKSIKLEKNKK